MVAGRRTFCRDDVLAITRLCGEVAEQPAADTEQTRAQILERLVQLTHSASAFSMIAVRTNREPDDPLRGWRPVNNVRWGVEADEQRLRDSWYREATLADDPHTRAMAGSTGAHRALLRGEVVDDETWRTSRHVNELLIPSKISDRLVAGFAIAPDVELFIGLDRKYGAPRYGERERDQLLATLVGLGWFHRRVARTHGLIDAHAPLTPRERAVIRLLLRGLGEKQIAAQLGLTVRSTHQVVVAIYRKLGVHSRAELMARWLNESAR